MTGLTSTARARSARVRRRQQGRSRLLVPLALLALGPEAARAFSLSLVSASCTTMVWRMQCTPSERQTAAGAAFFVDAPFKDPLFRQDIPMSMINFDANGVTTLSFSLGDSLDGVDASKPIGGFLLPSPGSVHATSDGYYLDDPSDSSSYARFVQTQSIDCPAQGGGFNPIGIISSLLNPTTTSSSVISTSTTSSSSSTRTSTSSSTTSTTSSFSTSLPPVTTPGFTAPQQATATILNPVVSATNAAAIAQSGSSSGGNGSTGAIAGGAVGGAIAAAGLLFLAVWLIRRRMERKAIEREDERLQREIDAFHDPGEPDMTMDAEGRNSGGGAGGWNEKYDGFSDSEAHGYGTSQQHQHLAYDSAYDTVATSAGMAGAGAGAVAASAALSNRHSSTIYDPQQSFYPHSSPGLNPSSPVVASMHPGISSPAQGAYSYAQAAPASPYNNYPMHAVTSSSPYPGSTAPYPSIASPAVPGAHTTPRPLSYDPNAVASPFINPHGNLQAMSTTPAFPPVSQGFGASPAMVSSPAAGQSGGYGFDAAMLGTPSQRNSGGHTADNSGIGAAMLGAGAVHSSWRGDAASSASTSPAAPAQAPMPNPPSYDSGLARSPTYDAGHSGEFLGDSKTSNKDLPAQPQDNSSLQRSASGLKRSASSASQGVSRKPVPRLSLEEAQVEVLTTPVMPSHGEFPSSVPTSVVTSPVAASDSARSSRGPLPAVPGGGGSERASLGLGHGASRFGSMGDDFGASINAALNATTSSVATQPNADRRLSTGRRRTQASAISLDPEDAYDGTA